jgi:glycerophosphoryl diester phosphodiesterase
VIFDARPAVVGHRGFGAGQAFGYRENSVESFLAAADAGIRWVELDARRCADGELVLWHDPVTPAGELILARTAGQLAAEGIVPLDDVLAALPGAVGVNVDVKTIIEDAVDPADQRTHALIADALRRHAGSRRFLVSSFDASLPSYLKRAAAGTGDVAFGLITEANFAASHAVSAAANLGLDAVCLNTATLHSAKLKAAREQAGPADHSAAHIIEVAHHAGLEVMVWSPDPADALALARAGADALCVNDIRGVQAALAKL